VKVMFVCTTGGSGRRQLGGAERFLAEMLPALAASGTEVVACTPDDDVAGSLRDAGVSWIELTARRRVDLGYASQIRRLVQRLRPDVVSAHLLSAAMHTRAALGVRGRRTPLAVTLHNSLWQYRDAAESPRRKAAVEANIVLDLALRRLRPHTTVAVSQFEADELRERGGISNVTVIPNPLPAYWPAAGRRPDRDGSRPARIGFLGRIEREKGGDLLGEIAALLPGMRLRIAGTGSVAVPRLPNVELLGRVDAADFLPQLDCLVVPSRVEAFGRSALEAMSLGVPVVHSGAGGLADLGRRADGVLAFQSDLRAGSLVSAIHKAVEGAGDHEQRAAMTRWYREEFAFARCVQRWTSLYRSVADDAR